MLSLRGPLTRSYSRLPRRELLSVGSLGLFGLTLPTLLRATESARDQVSPAKARRCILLFLTGGPPQLDTWDLKPHAPADIRGELKPIDTHVAGLQISELFPLVVCMGEFGRTPRINSFGGRDHWSDAQSIVLAGAGVRMGSIYGSTDQIGGNPSDHPVSPADVTATLLHLLGIPDDYEITDRAGRNLRACLGNPIAGVLA